MMQPAATTSDLSGATVSDASNQKVYPKTTGIAESSDWPSRRRVFRRTETRQRPPESFLVDDLWMTLLLLNQPQARIYSLLLIRLP